MDKVHIRPPDQRVNLGTGAVDDEAQIAESFAKAVDGKPSVTPIVEGVTVRVHLSPAEVALIVGPGVASQTEREDRCRNWLAGRLRSFGMSCRGCGGLLIGGERNVCGKCGGRAVAS